MYSTITKKKCKCGCKKYPTLGYDGYNFSCAPEEIKEKVGSKRDLTQKKRNARIYAAAKAKCLPENIITTEEKKGVESAELKLWFYYHMHNSPKVCENCNADLSHYNNKIWRGSQHHIIEKSPVNGCPSVATELENHAVLGFYCCHSQAGTSNLNLSKMPVFPLLKERFAKFEHLIAENERKNIPECFLMEIKQSVS